MITVFLRTFIVYVLLLVSVRLTGKRQIGELQITELIVTFMLSELASIPIIDRRTPLSYAVIPILFLLSLEVIFSFIMSKVPFLKKMTIGRPAVLIRRGIIDQKELARHRIDISELLSELRLKDVDNISDVEYAVLEDNGKLSVIKKTSVSPITPAAVSLPVPEGGMQHIIVADGKVFPFGLSNAEKSEAWLYNYLRHKHMALDGIFLMTVDDAGKISVIAKEE